MRDTQGDPRGGWPFGGCPACRVFASRVVEALGDELGELLHPRGEDSRDDAALASTSSPRTESTSRGCTVVVLGGSLGARRRDATRPSGRHSDAGQSAPS